MCVRGVAKPRPSTPSSPGGLPGLFLSKRGQGTGSLIVEGGSQLASQHAGPGDPSRRSSVRALQADTTALTLICRDTSRGLPLPPPARPPSPAAHGLPAIQSLSGARRAHGLSLSCARLRSQPDARRHAYLVPLLEPERQRNFLSSGSSPRRLLRRAPTVLRPGGSWQWWGLEWDRASFA